MSTITPRGPWAALSAPLPDGVVAWRQDGKPVQRNGRYFARFVAYIEANTVRERLDSVFPGEWSLSLELLPSLRIVNRDGVEEMDAETAATFKARLLVSGVTREDVGHGRDYKQAATDAFKRAAVRFGIGHELYAYEQNWVEVDGDGKYAKPLEDPQKAYERRYGAAGGASSQGHASTEPSATHPAVPARGEGATARPVGDPAGAEQTARAVAPGAPACPKCGSQMYDNRLTKRSPKAPDFKCRDRSCDGVIWPAKAGKAAKSQADAMAPPHPADGPEPDYDDDSLPF